MSKADEFRANALKRKGMEYEWGDEFSYKLGGSSTSKDNDGDCSGFDFATYRDTGILWKNGTAWPRLTANGYKYSAVLVTDGTWKVGDPFFRFNSDGRAVHTGIVIGQDTNGRWQFMEARGERWGVVLYYVDDPVNGFAARNLKHYRFPWVDLGLQTGTAVVRPTLHYKDVNKFVGEMKGYLNKAQNAGLHPNNFNFLGDTLREVEEFQAKNKDANGKPLEVDGIVGPKTWAALLKFA